MDARWREGRPDECLVFLPGLPDGRNVGIARRGQNGIVLARISPAAIRQPECFVREANEVMGVTPLQSFCMLVGGMFGWADPRSRPWFVELTDSRFCGLGCAGGARGILSGGRKCGPGDSSCPPSQERPLRGAQRTQH